MITNSVCIMAIYNRFVNYFITIYETEQVNFTKASLDSSLKWDNYLRWR